MCWICLLRKKKESTYIYIYMCVFHRFSMCFDSFTPDLAWFLMVSVCPCQVPALSAIEENLNALASLLKGFFRVTVSRPSRHLHFSIVLRQMNLAGTKERRGRMSHKALSCRIACKTQCKSSNIFQHGVPWCSMSRKANPKTGRRKGAAFKQPVPPLGESVKRTNRISILSVTVMIRCCIMLHLDHPVPSLPS